MLMSALLSWLQLTVISTLVISAKSDDCRILKFKPVIEGYALQGHVFKSVMVTRESACVAQCYKEADCVSYNVGPLINDGAHLCEMSHSDHDSHPDDLVPRKGFIYRPTENGCSIKRCPASLMCQNGFTDKRYRCITPPRVTLNFTEELLIMEGSHVVFTCNATGQPTPQITWRKIQGSFPSSRTIISEGNLTILNVTINDSGSYECTATNTAGTNSSSVELQVYSLLKFTTRPPSSVLVYSGQALNVSCSASSSLQPNVSWMYNGTTSLPDGVSTATLITLVIPSADQHHEGNYTCLVQNSQDTLQANFTVHVNIPETCSRVKTNVSDVSGDYVIDPDGEEGLVPFTVYCNMTDKGGVGVTVVSHDSEDRTYVHGFEAPGSYIREVNYVGSSSSQLRKLAEISSSCEQFIRYECKHSLLGAGHGWWVSRDGQKMTYWGRATHGCECDMTSSCADPLRCCNCNSNDNTWREDSGLFTNKPHLPVIQLRFGDTGESWEEAYHTLGKLKCYGMN